MRQTLLTLPLLLTLASSVLAEDDTALLEKCDGMTRAETIDRSQAERWRDWRVS